MVQSTSVMDVYKACHSRPYTCPFIKIQSSFLYCAILQTILSSITSVREPRSDLDESNRARLVSDRTSMYRSFHR